MRRLVVLLLEGFQDDEVVVSVDGNELARRPSASTSPLLGMAEELTLELPDTAQQLSVALPAQGLQATAVLLDGDPTMLVDVEAGALVVRPGTGHEGLL